MADGSTTTSSATASNGGASASVSPTLLAKGGYSVIAVGAGGSKASAVLNIK